MTVKKEEPDIEFAPSPSKKAKTTANNAAIKWTDEEIQLLCDLRSQKLDWEQIVGRFPGRSVMSLQSCYKRKVKEMTEVFDPMTDAILKDEIENYHRRKWENIGVKVGRSAGGCKKRATELGYIGKA